MIEIISILTIVFFITSIFVIYQYYRDHHKHQTVEKDQIDSFIEPNQKDGRLWLISQGYIEKGNILNLISDDGGVNWYVVEHGIEDPPILGTLEETHREVFLHPKAWEKLKDYVRRNGTINLMDERGVRLLEKAGFEVRIRAV